MNFALKPTGEQLSKPPYKLYVYNDLASAESVWKQFEAGACAHVYQLFEWAQTWMHTVGEPSGYALHIVEVRDLFGQPLMLVPLCHRQNSFGRHVHFIGEGMSDYLGPLVQKNFADQIAATGFDGLWNEIIATINAEIDVVWLDRLPATLEKVENPFLQLEGFAFESNANALDFPVADDWSKCARMLRSNKTIKKIERRIRQLAKTGPVELIEITETSARKKHMAELFASKIENLNDAQVLHQFDKPEFEQFYDALVSNPDAQENLLQFEMRCDDKIVASVFALSHHQTFFYQICAFNKEFAQYSPGMLLLFKLFDWSFSNGFKRFDMTIGDESYKGDWINDIVALKTVAIPYSTRGKLFIAKQKSIRWLKNKIKKSPMLRTIAIKLLKK